MEENILKVVGKKERIMIIIVIIIEKLLFLNAALKMNWEKLGRIPTGFQSTFKCISCTPSTLQFSIVHIFPVSIELKVGR